MPLTPAMSRSQLYVLSTNCKMPNQLWGSYLLPCSLIFLSKSDMQPRKSCPGSMLPFLMLVENFAQNPSGRVHHCLWSCTPRFDGLFSPRIKTLSLILNCFTFVIWQFVKFSFFLMLWKMWKSQQFQWRTSSLPASKLPTLGDTS